MVAISDKIDGVCFVVNKDDVATIMGSDDRSVEIEMIDDSNDVMSIANMCAEHIGVQNGISRPSSNFRL